MAKDWMMEMLRKGNTAEYVNGYAAGLKAGEKRERRRVRAAVRRFVGRGPHYPMIYGSQLMYMMMPESKPSLRNRARGKG